MIKDTGESEAFARMVAVLEFRAGEDGSLSRNTADLAKDAGLELRTAQHVLAAVAQKGLVNPENGTNTVDLVRLEARRQQLKGAGRTLVRVHRHLLQALSGAGARVAALARTRLAGEPMSLTRMATRLAIGKRAVQRHLAGLDGRWIVVGKQLCLDGKTRTTLVAPRKNDHAGAQERPPRRARMTTQNGTTRVATTPSSAPGTPGELRVNPLDESTGVRTPAGAASVDSEQSPEPEETGPGPTEAHEKWWEMGIAELENRVREVVDRCEPGQWRPVLRHATRVAKTFDVSADPADTMERVLVLVCYCLRLGNASGFDDGLRRRRRREAEDLVHRGYRPSEVLGKLKHAVLGYGHRIEDLGAYVAKCLNRGLDTIAADAKQFTARGMDSDGHLPQVGPDQTDAERDAAADAAKMVAAVASRHANEGQTRELAELTLTQLAGQRFLDSVVEIAEAGALEVLPDLVAWTCLSTPLRRRDLAFLMQVPMPEFNRLTRRAA